MAFATGLATLTRPIGAGLLVVWAALLLIPGWRSARKQAVRELAGWGVLWNRVQKGDHDVIIDGKKVTTLRGEGLAQQFQQIVEDYVARRWGGPSAGA